MRLDFLRQALEQGADLVMLRFFGHDTQDWEDQDTLMQWRESWFPKPAPPWLAWSRALSWLHDKREALRTGRAHIRHYRKLYDPAYSGWIRFDQAMREFKSQCDAKDARLLVVLFPFLSWELTEEGYPFHFIHEAVPQLDGHPNQIAHRLAAEAVFEHVLLGGLISPDDVPRTGHAEQRYHQILE